MRTRVMLRDPETGALRPGWSENVPGGYARVPGHSGSLVVGLPGFEEREKVAKRAARAQKAAA